MYSSNAKSTFRSASTITLVLALLSSQNGFTEESPNYSLGATLGSTGIGLTASSTTDWHWTQGDQIQWRLVISGLSDNNNDDIEFNSTDYVKGDISLFNVQAGVDWYPFHGWADKVFLSGGLMYTDFEFDGVADNRKSFSVGGKRVNQGDITSLRTEVEQDGFAPYISVGWGNKLQDKRGFDFQAEIGLVMPTSDPDVKVTAVDPGNFLTAKNLADERREIEDDLDGIGAFVMASVVYHF